MRRRTFVKFGLWSLMALATGLSSGCGPGQVAEPASPVVSAESEAGKKAREQDEQLRKLRSAQEAKARKHRKGLPVEE